MDSTILNRSHWTILTPSFLKKNVFLWLGDRRRLLLTRRRHQPEPSTPERNRATTTMTRIARKLPATVALPFPPETVHLTRLSSPTVDQRRSYRSSDPPRPTGTTGSPAEETPRRAPASKPRSRTTRDVYRPGKRPTMATRMGCTRVARLLRRRGLAQSVPRARRRSGNRFVTTISLPST